MKKASVIILAAGYSSRMGEFKPLLKINNRTFIEELVLTYKNAGVENIVIVTGHKHELIENVFKDKKIAKLVFNKNYDHGMYSSILTGLDSIDSSVYDSFFVNPVDCPLVESKTVEQLIKVFNNSDRDVVYPMYNGRRGHPPIISLRLKDYLLNYNGDNGLRGALREVSENPYELTVKDSYILDDIDNKQEYEKVLLRNK